MDDTLNTCVSPPPWLPRPAVGPGEGWDREDDPDERSRPRLRLDEPLDLPDRSDLASPLLPPPPPLLLLLLPPLEPPPDDGRCVGIIQRRPACSAGLLCSEDGNLAGGSRVQRYPSKRDKEKGSVAWKWGDESMIFEPRPGVLLITVTPYAGTVTFEPLRDLPARRRTRCRRLALAGRDGSASRAIRNAQPPAGKDIPVRRGGGRGGG